MGRNADGEEGVANMERLTKRWGAQPYPNLAGKVICEYKECGSTRGCENCIHGRYKDRLAAIEDILGYEYDLNRLRELAQADREGRCVVLPCKNGDPVWRLYDDCDFPGDCYTKQKCRGCEYRNLFIEEQAFCLSMLSQNGKLNPPYYTTRAEAEAALRREQDEQIKS